MASHGIEVHDTASVGGIRDQKELDLPGNSARRTLLKPVKRRIVWVLRFTGASHRDRIHPLRGSPMDIPDCISVVAGDFKGEVSGGRGAAWNGRRFRGSGFVDERLAWPATFHLSPFYLLTTAKRGHYYEQGAQRHHQNQNRGENLCFSHGSSFLPVGHKRLLGFLYPFLVVLSIILKGVNVLTISHFSVS